MKEMTLDKMPGEYYHENFMHDDAMTLLMLVNIAGAAPCIYY